MGLFGKPKTHKITSSYSYLPIRDPRKKKIKVEDLIPAMPGGNRAGEEFLQKYLYLVRNHMSRELVEEWIQLCAIRKESYIDAVSGDFDEDEFLGYMVQGFAMAVAEFESFEITKPVLMADCVWGAMMSFSVHILIESDREAQKVGLSAMLSGYHVAREILKINQKKNASPSELFTSSLNEVPKKKSKPKKTNIPVTNPPTGDEHSQYLRELGADPLTGRIIIIKSGRFGDYVSDGLTIATLRRGDIKEDLSLQRGCELLAGRREWEANAT